MKFESEYKNLHEPTDNLEYNHNEPKKTKPYPYFRRYIVPDNVHKDA